MKLDEIEYLVVGAGFFGATIAERIANDLGKSVTIIDKRNHIGGNCYSEINAETGIEVHKYGTHIFHTSNTTVWDYINRFTSFNGYNHQVLTTFENKVYQMPINLETINSFYNVNLKPFEVDEFLDKERAKEFYPKPQNMEEQSINYFGRPLYEALLKGYTIKQWDKVPSELPASIIQRLPQRNNYNENYYFDTWQGIPSLGYTKIFEKMLSSSLIKLQLNTDFEEIKEQLNEDTVIIYSGSLDRLFNFKYGQLDYRTLRFEEEVKNVADYQGTAVMNYAEKETPYTRIHEPKHLHPERDFLDDKTLIVKEYSLQDNGEAPYYPIGGTENKELYAKYLAEVAKMKNIIVGGRLGDYKYYDMHQTIENALSVYEQHIKQ